MKKAILLAAFFLLAAAISMMAGPVWLWPWSFFGPGELNQVIFNLRITRTLLGVLSGGILAGCGLYLQGLLNNPLVEPYTLGTASGAALGAAVSLVLFHFVNPVFSFFGAIAASGVVVLTGRFEGRFTRERLILSGVVLSFLCSSLVMIILVLGGKELGEIIYLLMGNLGLVVTGARLPYYLVLAAAAVVIYVIVFSRSRELDIMSSGIETARSLGVNTERLTLAVFLLVSLMVALVVSVVGAVGFVGLVVPHITRKIFGSAHHRVALASFFLGGAFVLLADAAARSVTPIEMPVGVVTSLIGVPFFLILQARRR